MKFQAALVSVTALFMSCRTVSDSSKPASQPSTVASDVNLFHKAKDRAEILKIPAASKIAGVYQVKTCDYTKGHALGQRIELVGKENLELIIVAAEDGVGLAAADKSGKVIQPGQVSKRFFLKISDSKKSCRDDQPLTDDCFLKESAQYNADKTHFRYDYQRLENKDDGKTFTTSSDQRFTDMKITADGLSFEINTRTHNLTETIPAKGDSSNETVETENKIRCELLRKTS